jgi:hypothetical protein
VVRSPLNYQRSKSPINRAIWFDISPLASTEAFSSWLLAVSKTCQVIGRFFLFCHECTNGIFFCHRIRNTVYSLWHYETSASIRPNLTNLGIIEVLCRYFCLWTEQPSACAGLLCEHVLRLLLLRKR